MVYMLMLFLPSLILYGGIGNTIHLDGTGVGDHHGDGVDHTGTHIGVHLGDGDQVGVADLAGVDPDGEADPVGAQVGEALAEATGTDPRLIIIIEDQIIT